jgi:hypothetical protein
MVQACDSSTQEAEAGGVSLRPAWSMYRDPEVEKEGEGGGE